MIPHEKEPGPLADPGRCLVYTTAFGPAYFFELAEELCRSLEKVGFAGDVVVLTDRPHDFTNARSVVMTHDPVLYKAGLTRRVDVSRYDRILCCDGDVVFLRNPAPLLACAADRLAFSYELDHPLQAAAHNLRYFMPEERRRIAGVRHPLLNVGLTAFPAFRAAEYCELWERHWVEWAPDRFQIWEQAVMQKLVTLRHVDSQLLPKRFFSFPLLKWDPRPLGEETVAVHPCGLAWNESNKRRVLQIMRAFNAAGSHEERADLHDQVRRREWGRFSSF